MNYEVTLTLRLGSRDNEDRIAKLLESLFEFGTIKESIVDGLHLLKDPRLVAVAVKRAAENELASPDGRS